jgi:hypothetical protein
MRCAELRRDENDDLYAREAGGVAARVAARVLEAKEEKSKE